MRSTVKYASMNLTVFFVKWELCPSITAKGLVLIVCLNFDTTSYRNVLKSSWLVVLSLTMYTGWNKQLMETHAYNVQWYLLFVIAMLTLLPLLVHAFFTAIQLLAVVSSMYTTGRLADMTDPNSWANDLRSVSSSGLLASSMCFIAVVDRCEMLLWM